MLAFSIAKESAWEAALTKADDDDGSGWNGEDLPLTLFQSALSCADEGDLIGVHHVIRSIFQEEPDS